MFKLKVIVVGPQKVSVLGIAHVSQEGFPPNESTDVIHFFQCGKTVIANFLADATESNGSDYHPTQGVRILQFESGNLSVNGQSVKADVELWDCSGDHTCVSDLQ